MSDKALHIEIDYSKNEKPMPYLLRAIYTKDGPETDFGDGTGRRPEPMVSFELLVDRSWGRSDWTLLYKTPKASYVPFMEGASDIAYLMSLAWYATFWVGEPSAAVRDEVLGIVGEIEYPTLLGVDLPPYTLEIPHMKYGTFYHLEEHDIGGTKVWLKRSLERKTNIIRSRWSFVRTEKRTSNIEVENKLTISQTTEFDTAPMTLANAIRQYNIMSARRSIVAE